MIPTRPNNVTLYLPGYGFVTLRAMRLLVDGRPEADPAKVRDEIQWDSMEMNGRDLEGIEGPEGPLQREILEAFEEEFLAAYHEERRRRNREAAGISKPLANFKAGPQGLAELTRSIEALAFRLAVLRDLARAQGA